MRLRESLSSRKWGNLGQSKNKLKIFFVVTHRKIHKFFIFQGLIHETNLIALGSLKQPNSFSVLNNVFSYTQVVSAFVFSVRI